MKNTTETKISSHWQRWRQSPNFFKSLFIYFFILIIFLLSIGVVLYRYKNKMITIAPAVIIKKASAPVASSHAKDPLQKGTMELNHLTAIVDNQLQPTLKMTYLLIAIELMQEVLDGKFPLTNLNLYIKKNSGIWTPNLFIALSSIKNIQTYEELQTSLILPPLNPSASLWQRGKDIIKSIVVIRKLNTLEDVQKALKTHNITQALAAFDKLPSSERAKLSQWKAMAMDRLTLEKIKQQMLLELSEN